MNNEPITFLNRHGKIILITGCMFSGKTQYLINRVERYTLSDKRIAVIGWKDDNRFTDEKKIQCHNKQNYPCIKMNNNDLLSNLSSIKKKFDVIGIDEGFFFKDLVFICESLANAGIVVLVSSITGTYKREPFETITNLIPKCDDIIFLKAICNVCKNENASFTFLNDKKLITAKQGSIDLIGGSDKYKALCRKCYNENS